MFVSLFGQSLTANRGLFKRGICLSRDRVIFQELMRLHTANFAKKNLEPWESKSFDIFWIA